MTGPTPLAQIIAQEIASAHRIVDAINSKAVNYYKLRKATIIQNNETNPPEVRPTPLPETPLIFMVNDAAIAAGETANSLDLNDALIAVKYVDPDPVAIVPDGSDVVIDTAHPFAPGCYRTLSGNPHYLPAHFHKTQDGKTFSWELGLAIGGYWQQVA